NTNKDEALRRPFRLLCFRRSLRRNDHRAPNHLLSSLVQRLLPKQRRLRLDDRSRRCSRL
ncbi:unnamed protein product, partial [Oikopleura dioica]